MPSEPPAHPVLPRPAPANLKQFHVGSQPATKVSPPLVTLTPDNYAAVKGDFGELLRWSCQASWLLDYYEGKNDGKQSTDFCAAPAPQAPAKK